MMLNTQISPYRNFISINSPTPFLDRNNVVPIKGSKVAYVMAGGTVNTDMADGGTRVGSLGVINKMQGYLGDSVGFQYSPFKAPIDSSNYTRDLQRVLTETLSKAVLRQEHGIKSGVEKAKGIIVTHGTDTMEENSALTAYLHRGHFSIPIVYTGSCIGPFEEGSDAIPNILKSLKIAEKADTPSAVFVVIGNEIHLATRVHKTNTKPLAADMGDEKAGTYFKSVDGKPVGKIDADGSIVFRKEFLQEWEQITKTNPLEKYNISVDGGIKPAYVEHLVVNSNTDTEVFGDLAKRLSNKAKSERCGVVIEGQIKDAPEIKAILDVMKNNANITVINSSEIKGLYPMPARIKLAALLGMKEIPSQDISKLMETNIAGEIVDKEGVEKTKWNIPQDFIKAGEFVVAFPGMERSVIDDAVSRLVRKTHLQDKVLLINAYGDGNLPIGAMSMKERLFDGFNKIGKSDIAQKAVESIYVEAKGAEANFLLPNVIKHIQKVSGTDEAGAKAMLKQAMIQTNEILKAISDAVSKGINVKIGSKADYATPNLNAYEIGTILNLVGAQGIDTSTNDFFTKMT